MIIQGEAFWAKVLKPVQNYTKTGEEYVIDVTVDAETRTALEAEGLGHKIRPAVDSKGREHASKQDYIKVDIPTSYIKGGVKEMLPVPKIKDRYGADWDKEKLIGNGSTVRVMFDIRSGDKPSPWRKPSLRGVMVVDHVPVEPKEDFAYDEAGLDEEAWT